MLLVCQFFCLKTMQNQKNHFYAHYASCHFCRAAPQTWFCFPANCSQRSAFSVPKFAAHQATKTSAPWVWTKKRCPVSTPNPTPMQATPCRIMLWSDTSWYLFATSSQKRRHRLQICPQLLVMDGGSKATCPANILSCHMVLYRGERRDRESSHCPLVPWLQLIIHWLQNHRVTPPHVR